FGALPLGRPIRWILRIPGIAHALDLAYRLVAPRRQRISVLCGLDACGIDPSTAAPSSNPDAAPLDASGYREQASRRGEDGAPANVNDAPPSTRMARAVSGALREACAAIALVAMLAQTGAANAIPRALKLPQGHVLAAIAAWPRMLARWDVLSPEPPD